MQPNKSGRISSRSRHLLALTVLCLIAASCSQGPTTAGTADSAPTSTGATQTQAPADSVDKDSADSSAPETTPSGDTNPESEAPAEPPAEPEPAKPSVLPAIQMTDVVSGDPYAIDQLSGGEGDILLWFYLPT